MKYALLFFCLTAFAQVRPAPTPLPARIEGRVVDSDDKPVPRATVKVTLAFPAEQSSVQVGDDGTFAIDQLKPGDSYGVAAERAGYLPGRVGADPGTFTDAESSWFSLDAGEIMRVTLRLIRPGAITGRITDQAGEPIPNAEVQAFRPGFILGVRELVSSLMVRTDDRGMYRLAPLQPGTYYIAAGSQARPEPGPVQNLRTYSPAATNAEGARPLTVEAGAEVRANIVLRRGPVFSIRGKVLSASGDPVPRIFPFARTKDGRTLGQGQANAKGEFVLSGLPSGDYLVGAGDPALPGVWVTVGASDVNDLVLTPSPVMPVPGRFVVVDGDLKVGRGERQVYNCCEVYATSVADPAFVLLPEDGRHPYVMFTRPGPDIHQAQSVMIKEGGAFEIPSISREQHHLTVGGLPDNYYVKSVRMGDQDVTHAPLNLTGEPIEIVISGKAAQISGPLESPDLSVMLWPETEDPGAAVHGIRRAGIGKNGKFRIVGLPPGTYRIAAFDTDQRGILWSYQFISKFTAEAAKVEIAESAKLIVEPPMVPAARFKEEFDKLP